MSKERHQTYRPSSESTIREENGLDLEALSDEDLEALLFEEESQPTSKGAFNLPTVAGLSLILVGMMYIFQHLGMLTGLDMTRWVQILPWLAGILIILLGLGVLSWRPRRKATVRKRKTRKDISSEKTRVEEAELNVEAKKRLVKSKDKKLTGVCAGIADYFNIDPTLVRIAFVIGTLVTNGAFLLAYIILSIVMPKETPETEDRITIIRD